VGGKVLRSHAVMPATELLYHHDSLLLAFEARVVAHARFAGRDSVILDRTAFYPEAGGQMADRGALGGLPVVDVQIDDAGLVHHLLDGAPPAVGAEVAGTIDRERRRAHMALHTGQHMLSRALVDVARGETVSSRLGETACTIDIDLASIDDAGLARAEELVNAVIDDDAPIRAFFPEPGELAALPLRRQPKVTENIRVVAIGDFDVSPCGGTHCLRTAQVGLVKVTGVERYKGKMRVTFVAGRRARAELGSHADTLRGLGRELTCGPDHVPAALAKLRRDLQDARELLGQARARLVGEKVDALVAAARAAGRREVAAFLEDGDVSALRLAAKRITSEPGLVAILAAGGEGGVHILCARGAGSDFDCGAFVKEKAAALGGRGGGSPERAEGRVPAGAITPDRWPG
jgi:alanyl-tRNA synthetase